MTSYYGFVEIHVTNTKFTGSAKLISGCESRLLNLGDQNNEFDGGVEEKVAPSETHSQINNYFLLSNIEQDVVLGSRPNYSEALLVDMFTKCLDFTTLPLLSNVSAPRKARNAAGANFLLCCHKEPKGVEGVSVPEHLNPLFLPQISVNQSTQPNLFTCEARNTSLPSLRATRFFPEWPLYQILGYTLFSHSVGMYVTLKRAALGKANGRINKINDIDQG